MNVSSQNKFAIDPPEKEPFRSRFFPLVCLKDHFLYVSLANIFALLLGITAAMVTAMIGPALKLLMTKDLTAKLSIMDLFGAKFAYLAANFFGTIEISAETLFRTLPFVLIIIALLKSSFGLFQWFLWEKIGELVSRDIRNHLITKYLQINPAEKLKKAKRDLEADFSSIVTTDVKVMKEYIVHFYGGLPREVIQIIFLAITLVLYSTELFLIFFVGIIPAFLLISNLGKRIRRRAKKALQGYAELTEWLQQRLLGIETIKHYHTEDLETGKFESLTTDLFHRFRRAAMQKAQTSPMLEIVAIFSMVIVLIIALYEVHQGKTSGSVLISFFSSLVLLSQSAEKVGKYFNSSREGAAAIDRIKNIFYFLSENIKIEVRQNIEQAVGTRKFLELSCQRVSFLYPEQNIAALKNFTYDFPAGKIYCLCGASGAGKSTFLRLALGLIQPTSGNLTIKASSHYQGAAKICYMPQNIRLVPSSLLLNVTYPEKTGDISKITSSIERVGMQSVVDSLPDGYHTDISEAGRGFSGGQSQRIQLSRLFYHGCPIVLVDEGTSSLDPETEALVFRSLRELADNGALVIMIAHRYSAMEFADQVLLLKNGQLIFSDTPAVARGSKIFRENIGGSL